MSLQLNCNSNLINQYEHFLALRTKKKLIFIIAIYKYYIDVNYFKKNIEKLGEAIEADAISLHAVAMTSNPPIYYLNSRTWGVISELLKLRKKGILGYFTMDAGPNVHVICEKEHKDILEKKFKNYPGVEFIITSKVCDGAKTIDEHLF